MARFQHDHVPGSLTLVLNASEGLLQLILADEATMLCRQEWDAPTRSTEILAPALRQMLSGLGLAPAHVGRIACVRGPGSFTGIRLILATAAALRRTTGARTAGLDYLEALARGAGRLSLPPQAGQAVWVLTHARRDLVHARRFVWQAGGRPAASGPVELLPPAEAAARIAQDGSAGLPPVVLGSALERNGETLRQACPDARFAPDGLRHPDCRDLLSLAQEAGYANADIEPLYVRPCDAVDNLPHLAARQGMAPEDAEAALERMLHAAPASTI